MWRDIFGVFSVLAARFKVALSSLGLDMKERGVRMELNCTICVEHVLMMV
jgi:hypothetical protein